MGRVKVKFAGKNKDTKAVEKDLVKLKTILEK
jgi:hypothetical protein